jgi:hypothetical protein
LILNHFHFHYDWLSLLNHWCYKFFNWSICSLNNIFV